MTKDIILFASSLLFTLALTGVGVEMANNPPTTKGKKWFYRGLFALFGISVLVTSTWGFVRSSAAQNKNDIQIGAMGQQLSDIKTTVNRVADSSNCPEIKQLAATVNKIAQTPSAAPVAYGPAAPSEPKLSSLSNSEVTALVRPLADKMQDLHQRFMADDDETIADYRDIQKRNEKRAELRDLYAKREAQLTAEANNLEATILQRLGQTSSRVLKCNSGEDGEYLRNIAGKLPPDGW
jgi:hypothetical protein